MAFVPALATVKVLRNILAPRHAFVQTTRMFRSAAAAAIATRTSLFLPHRRGLSDDKHTHLAIDMLRRLRDMDTCALCDASAKQARVVATVKPLRQGYKMVGRVRTVHVDGDFLEIICAIRGAVPGDVLMIDASMRGAPEDAAWPRAGGLFGELLAYEAQRRSVAGMVIDGNCRDTPITQLMDMPIYSRGTHPNAGTAWNRGQTQCEIMMGGVSVHPGEYVLGDDDGVVVCSEEELVEWLPKAAAIQRVEASMLAHIQSGGSLFDKIPNFDEHLAALSCGDKESRLKFD